MLKYFSENQSIPHTIKATTAINILKFNTLNCCVVPGKSFSRGLGLYSQGGNFKINAQ